MKRKKNFKIWLRTGLILGLLSVILTSCYRNASDEYINIDGISYSQENGGVLMPYNPDVPPVFKDGKYEGILASVYNNLAYPVQARANQTEGYADIQFRLQPNGTVDEVVIKKDLADGCGEAAAEAVRKGLGGKTYEPTGVTFDLYGFLRIYFELN